MAPKNLFKSVCAAMSLTALMTICAVHARANGEPTFTRGRDGTITVRDKGGNNVSYPEHTATVEMFVDQDYVTPPIQRRDQYEVYQAHITHVMSNNTGVATAGEHGTNTVKIHAVSPGTTTVTFFAQIPGSQVEHFTITVIVNRRPIVVRPAPVRPGVPVAPVRPGAIRILDDSKKDAPEKPAEHPLRSGYSLPTYRDLNAPKPAVSIRQGVTAAGGKKPVANTARNGAAAEAVAAYGYNLQR